jgi:sporulation protein YunB
MKLKQYKKKTIGTYLSRELIFIILAFLCALLLINYFHKRFNDAIMPIAEAKTRKYVTEIINNSTDNIKFENDLFVIEKSNDNEIKMVTYNSYEATQLINKITHNIQDSFDELESVFNGKDKFVVDEIPLGVIFDNALLRNFGPKIRVRLDIVGDVLSELETEVKPYGINNALVEVRVKLNANARVILPLTTKEINVSNVIPISINIVNGSIPEAYIATYK